MTLSQRSRNGRPLKGGRSRLALRRRELGMTQNHVAITLRCNRMAVSRWECKRARPSADNLLGLASLLGMTVEEVRRLTSRECA